MLKVGDIYYLSDQFGPKFVKIIMIGDIHEKNDNWVYFYKSTWLNNIVKVSYPENGLGNLGCDKSQVKKWHFEKLLDRFTYTSSFKGCIKINGEIVQAIKDNRESDIIKLIKNDPNIYPYMEVIRGDRCLLQHDEKLVDFDKCDIITCKKISKQDFRNIKLNKILE